MLFRNPDRQPVLSTNCIWRVEGSKNRGEEHPRGGESRGREIENALSSCIILSRLHPGSLAPRNVRGHRV